LAARQDPGSIETLNAIAVSYDRLGRFDLSHRYFTQALSLQPESAQTLNNIGRSLLAQGQVDLALAYLQQAHRHDGTSPVILANLQLAEARNQAQQQTVARHDAPRPATLPTPAAWIERTTSTTQTLVTSPPPDLLKAALRPGVDARLVGFSAVDTALSHPGGYPSRFAVWAAASDANAAAAAVPEFTLEVSNGAGRRHMAARTRRYLAARGLKVAWLSNADSFAHEKTVIFYRPGYGEEARRVVEALPTKVEWALEERQHSDVRLRLGRDLLEFDRRHRFVSPGDLI
jgi:tetratricopeptide (TPR) repeat protein